MLLATTPDAVGQSTCASLVKNIGFQNSSGQVEYVTKINSTTALFFAKDQYYGQELWRTDGTPQGTVMVKDIAPGVASSGIGYAYERWRAAQNKPVASNGILYFEADDGIHGHEVWRSDGTEAGTFMLKDLNLRHKDGQVRGFHVFKGEVYFWDYSVTVGRTEEHLSGDLFRLFKTQGTPETTQLVSQFEGNNFTHPGKLFEYNGALYFSLEGLFYRGGSTVKIHRIDESGNKGSIDVNFGWVSQLGSANGKLFFTTDKGLYKSDGTTNGTKLIRESGGGVFATSEDDGPFWGVGNTVCWLRGGSWLWRSDETLTGTYALGSGNIYRSWDNQIPQVMLYKNALYFVDYGSSNLFKGPKLWKKIGRAHV